MMDPDAPSRQNPKAAQWLHWLVVNLSGEAPNLDANSLQSVQGTVQYLGLEIIFLSSHLENNNFYPYVLLHSYCLYYLPCCLYFSLLFIFFLSLYIIPLVTIFL
jgi:hypothetical protein